MAIIDKIQLSGTVYTIGNETTTAVTSASTDNEIPTAKAVYDAIPQGGGGKAIEAGRGISITTGETADTVSLNEAISASTASSSTYIAIGSGANAVAGYNAFLTNSGGIAIGSGATANRRDICIGNGANGYNINHSGLICIGLSSVSKQGGISIGNYSEAYGESGFDQYGGISIGFNSKTQSRNAIAIGYNTVASGTTKTNINNQIKVDDSNQVYIYNKDNTEMICLQDQLGGGGSSYTAGDGIDITNDVISVTGKVDTSAFTAHTADTVIHVTSAEKAAWNSKQDALVSGTNIKTINGETLLGEGNIEIQGGGGSSINVVQTTGASTADVMSQDAITNALRKTNLVSASYSSGHLDLESKDPFNTSYRTMLKFGMINGMTVANIGSTRPSFSLVETSAITTSVTSESTDTQVPSAKAVNDKLGGLSLVKLTQSEYDSLSTKNNSTLYVIVN